METRNTSRDLPPGFRFHPTDEELIMYYLKNQATSKPCPVSIIPEVDIYKFDPWQLPEKTEFGENEWYFFSPRDRKYPNGARPNRATVSGYWKATGTDKAIYSGAKYVGVKKALVFYKGRPPKGVKTDWIMHEYRLIESRSQPNKHNGTMRLDDWVLCRIYKKKPMAKTLEQLQMEENSPQGQIDDLVTNEVINDDPTEMLKFARTCSLSNMFVDMDQHLGSIGQLLNDSSYNNPTFDFQSNSNYNGTNGSTNDQRFHYNDMSNQYEDMVKYQMMNVNSMYEFQ